MDKFIKPLVKNQDIEQCYGNLQKATSSASSGEVLNKTWPNKQVFCQSIICDRPREKHA